MNPDQTQTAGPASGQCGGRAAKAVLIVARRLDGVQSGSGQYLKGYLEVCKAAGFATTLVFSPRRAFGNVAWARLHPDIQALVGPVDWAQSIGFGRLFVSTSPSVWWGFLRRIIAELRRRIGGQKHAPYPSLLGAELDPQEAHQVVSRVRALGPDIVAVEYSSLAPLLASFPRSRRIVLLHDLFSLRAESFLSGGMEPDHVILTLEAEAERCRAADLMVHASCIELESLKKELPQVRHVWMPPSVRPFLPRSNPDGTPHAVFIGSRHGGNAAALAFLRKCVWPDVRKYVPGATLHVVGTIAATVDPADAEREGLRLVGVVEDLSAIGGPDAVGLAPVQFGSGIPIKIVDYLAVGMPVAVTPGAIAAFGGALSGLVVEAKTDQHYPQLIAGLLSDRDARCDSSVDSEVLKMRLENSALLESLRSLTEPTNGMGADQDAPMTPGTPAADFA